MSIKTISLIVAAAAAGLALSACTQKTETPPADTADTTIVTPPADVNVTTPPADMPAAPADTTTTTTNSDGSSSTTTTESTPPAQ